MKEEVNIWTHEGKDGYDLNCDITIRERDEDGVYKTKGRVEMDVKLEGCITEDMIKNILFNGAANEFDNKVNP